jgi:heme-degrading monooxygenase HmoA
MIANIPKPPYYAVIFTSSMSEDVKDYEDMSNKMVELPKMQEGFLQIESARNVLGITVSYWDSLEVI